MVAGTAMNMTSWWVNHGMPVLNWARESDWVHHAATDADHLPWLWDRVPLPFGFIASFGDFFLAAGFLLVVATLVRCFGRACRSRLVIPSAVTDELAAHDRDPRDGEGFRVAFGAAGADGPADLLDAAESVAAWRNSRPICRAPPHPTGWLLAGRRTRGVWDAKLAVSTSRATTSRGSRPPTSARQRATDGAGVNVRDQQRPDLLDGFRPRASRRLPGVRLVGAPGCASVASMPPSIEPCVAEGAAPLPHSLARSSLGRGA